MLDADELVLEQFLVATPDLPVPVFSSLVNKLAEKTKNLHIHIVTNNTCGNSSDNSLRLAVALKAGIRLTDDTGAFRRGPGGISVISYTPYNKQRDVLIEHFLQTSGDELQGLQQAFAKDLPCLPRPTSIPDQVKLFVHLRLIPDWVRDPVVLLECARGGVFHEDSKQFFEEYLLIEKELTHLKVNRAADLRANRDSKLKTNARISELIEQANGLDTELTHVQRLRKMAADQISELYKTVDEKNAEVLALQGQVLALQEQVSIRDQLVQSATSRIPQLAGLFNGIKPLKNP